MTPAEIFETNIANRLADPAASAKAREIDAVYQFNLSGESGGAWVVDLKNGKAYAGEAPTADCTINVAAQDFVNLYQGKVAGPQLFMMGKLKVTGNMGPAMKLGSVLAG